MPQALAARALVAWAARALLLAVSMDRNRREEWGSFSRADVSKPGRVPIFKTLFSVNSQHGVPKG